MLFSSLLFISCSGDDMDGIGSADYNARIADVFIYDSDLVGEWKIGAVVVDRNVDLDGDGDLNDDLLEESVCFEKMTYTFRGDKTFTIINPSIEFKGVDDKDEYNCISSTSISGKWSIKDDMLSLYIRRNNVEYQELKHLILIDDTFFLEINKDESKKFIDDKGTSSASGLSVVALEFKRTSKKL